MDGMFHILHVEDDENDAELIAYAIAKDGIPANIIRVDSKAEITKNLLENSFDLIISDSSMPGFDGKSVLKLAQKIAPATPFIFVSGTIGERGAIESLLQGATDYVLKTNLSRLIPSIRRALAAATQRKLLEDIETTPSGLGERDDVTYEYAPLGILKTDSNGTVTDTNAVIQHLTGYSDEELKTIGLAGLTPPDELFLGADELRILIGEEQDRVELEQRYLCKNGDILSARVTVLAVHDAPGGFLHAITVAGDEAKRKQENGE